MDNYSKFQAEIITEVISTQTDALFSLLCTKNVLGILTMQALDVTMVGNQFIKCDAKRILEEFVIVLVQKLHDHISKT